MSEMATLSLLFIPPEYLRHCLSATPLSQRFTLLNELSTACTISSIVPSMLVLTIECIYSIKIRLSGLLNS